ncbi:Pkinase-domain-containing protein [Thozetella sp. PMI_491]|nr:Pkinase-domain-containing protein [Thozetella sp. PMI_491]
MLLAKSFQKKTPTSRFVLDPDLPGGHQHYLGVPATTTPSDRSSFWKSVLGGSERLRDKLFPAATKGNGQKKAKEEERDTSDRTLDAFGPRDSLNKHYGKPWKTIGRGAYGTVTAFRRQDKSGQGDKFFAVKQFHRRPGQTHESCVRRALAEFRIASTLQHENVIRVLDLLEDEEKELYEMMELCAGGDLHALVSSAGQLGAEEANCFFKQLMCGVEYLHGIGLAHRDLKPENLLLTADGRVKISDFGFSQTFRSSSEESIELLSGVRGSAPYIAPEAYTDDKYDGRAVDIWACGVVYIFMRLNRFLWLSAEHKDRYYLKYLDDRRHEEGHHPIEELEPVECRNTLYCVLDPVPRRRLTAAQFLKSKWGRDINTCSVSVPIEVEEMPSSP